MKVSLKKIIIFLWIIWILICSLFLLNMSKKTTDISATQQEIEVFNTIVSKASSKNDIDKCNSIWNKELEELCKSQLENRFSPLYWADNLSICRSDKEPLKQDMCILDLAYNKAKDNTETGLCNEILTQDIKDACFSQISNKKF